MTTALTGTSGLFTRLFKVADLPQAINHFRGVNPSSVSPHPLDWLPPDEDHELRYAYPRNPRDVPRAAGSTSTLLRQVQAALEQTREFKWARRQMAQARGF
jgi:hypothetical protein